MFTSVQAILLLGFLSISWSCASADVIETGCNSTVLHSTSSFSFPQKLNFTGPCTITVTDNTGTLGVEINAATLEAAGASLVVYDGNFETSNPAVVNISQNQVGLAAVFTASNVTFVLNVTKAYSSNSLSVNLNAGCNYIEKVSSVRYLEWHPLFKNTSKFTCTYQYNVENPTTPTKLALSFRNFQLSNTNLTIVGDTTTSKLSGTSIPADAYGLPLNLTLSVNETDKEQLFSATLTPVYSDLNCSKEHVVSSTEPKDIQLAIPPSPEGYDCRIVLKASQGKSLKINIAELRLAGIQDTVTMVDGASISTSPVLDKLTQNTAGYLILSSGNTVTARFVADSVQGQRNFIFSATELSSVNRFVGDTQFTIPGGSGAVSYYVLQASSPSSGLKFLLEGSKETTFEVKVLDGSQPSSPLLATFSSEMRYPVLSSGKNLFLEVNSSTSLTVNSTTVPLDGCEKMSVKDVGSFELKPAKGLDQCAWTVAPPQKGLIELTFDTLTLTQDTQLEVYSGAKNTSTGVCLLLLSNSSPQLPPPIVISDVMQLVFNVTGNANLSLVSVTANYQLVSSGCGGELGTSGVLSTPGFPNQYALNSKCTWTIPASLGSVRLFNFEVFLLGPGHKLVFSQFDGIKTTVIQEYEGGESIKKDLIYTSNLTNTVSFEATPQTQSIAVGGGFKINYWIMTCGESFNVTQGSFSTKDYLKSVSNTLCIWVISLPATSLSVVNFTLTYSGPKPFNETVKIYEGGSLSDPLMQSFDLSRPHLSRNNSVVVVFNATGATGNCSLSGLFSTYECNRSCANGFCMHPDWICNGKNDCGDNTDELNCGSIPIPITTPTPKPTPASSRGDEVRGYVVAILFFVGLVIGIMLVFVVRKVRQRMRGNRYQSFGGEEN